MRSFSIRIQSIHCLTKNSMYSFMDSNLPCCLILEPWSFLMILKTCSLFMIDVYKMRAYAGQEWGSAGPWPPVSDQERNPEIDRNIHDNVYGSNQPCYPEDSSADWVNTTEVDVHCYGRFLYSTIHFKLVQSDACIKIGVEVFEVLLIIILTEIGALSISWAALVYLCQC